MLADSVPAAPSPKESYPDLAPLKLRDGDFLVAIGPPKEGWNILPEEFPYLDIEDLRALNAARAIRKKAEDDAERFADKSAEVKRAFSETDSQELTYLNMDDLRALNALRARNMALSSDASSTPMRSTSTTGSGRRFSTGSVMLDSDNLVGRSGRRFSTGSVILESGPFSIDSGEFRSAKGNLIRLIAGSLEDSTRSCGVLASASLDVDNSAACDEEGHEAENSSSLSSFGEEETADRSPSAPAKISLPRNAETLLLEEVSRRLPEEPLKLDLRKRVKNTFLHFEALQEEEEHKIFFARRRSAPCGAALGMGPSVGDSPSEASAEPSQSENIAYADNGPLSGGEPTWTTMTLRNLPRDCGSTALTRTLDESGFRGCYDFIYVPIDFRNRVGLGYAFLNLTSPEHVPTLVEIFHGFRDWGFCSATIGGVPFAACDGETAACQVAWSRPFQGLLDHVERYRNSPVMHDSVPDECKPRLYAAGLRIMFPGPTIRLRAPRFRPRRPQKGSMAAEQDDGGEHVC